jgi:hypothetical protein
MTAQLWPLTALHFGLFPGGFAIHPSFSDPDAIVELRFPTPNVASLLHYPFQLQSFTARLLAIHHRVTLSFDVFSVWPSILLLGGLAFRCDSIPTNSCGLTHIKSLDFDGTNSEV